MSMMVQAHILILIIIISMRTTLLFSPEQADLPSFSIIRMARNKPGPHPRMTINPAGKVRPKLLAVLARIQRIWLVF
jgi:hypothetical protein